MKKEKIIFFGNGLLADASLEVLRKNCEVIFHAKRKDDLGTVKKLKEAHPEIYGVLASFGVVIKDDILELFEPEGILNIHPSLLPLYRGASPIETAILNGDTAFSVSIMKLAHAMDAGPIYWQTTLKDLPLDKAEIYRALATTGAKWVAKNLTCLPEPVEQDNKKATFTKKINKAMAKIDPDRETADEILRKIVAFQGFPKTKYSFFGISCIILKAHIINAGDTAPLILKCCGAQNIAIDYLQPENRKPMDVKSFLNGYSKN